MQSPLPFRPAIRGSLRVPRVAVVALLALAAACSDSPTGVVMTEAPLAPPPSASAAVLAADPSWPVEGAWLAGRQKFMAALKDRPLNSYKMYWQVDGDRLNAMYDSHVGGPHKEASVDVSGWKWRGSGPYEITFVAHDNQGNPIATRTTTIHIGTAPSAAPAPAPAPAPGASVGNPFAGATLWVDPNSDARRQVNSWLASRPADAALIDQIARRPQAVWLGEWYRNVRSSVNQITTSAVAAGTVPVFVAYNIPQRDCGQYSAGGLAGPDAYRAWIREVAAGIGTRRAVVILEPDALGLLTDCLSASEQQLRLTLMSEAIRTLKAGGGVAVYVDAGNSRWHGADVMAARLRGAGIEHADGFSLNISNYHTTEANIAYGETVSRLVGGKHFVIDTSRNGVGPTADYQWCNPSGRALGHPPTVNTGNPLVDAFLWIKRPGESDGTCNGGPSAGAWWAENAIGLVQRMPRTLAMLP